jgi:hypothetical protein
MTTTLDTDVLRLMATAQDATQPDRQARHRAMEALFAELLKYSDKFGFTFNKTDSTKVLATFPKPWNNVKNAVVSYDRAKGSWFLAPYTNTEGEGEPIQLAISYDPYLQQFVEETKPDATTHQPRSAVYVIIATLTGTLNTFVFA